MKIETVGLDIAKHIFQAHGVDRTGKVVLRKRLRRAEVSSFFAGVEPCLIGLEASGGAHYWFRVLSRLGHTVRLIAPQFVKPYVKSQKNDANDAEAICEAVSRPSMRFVPAKRVEQQDLRCLPRVRSWLIGCRTQLVNQIRGLLAEYGIVIPQHIAQLHRYVPALLEDDGNELTISTRHLFHSLYEELIELETK
jgi:transposase